MKKLIIIMFLFTLIMTPGQVSAETEVFTGMADYQRLQTALNFIADTFAGNESRLQDIRVSPLIMSENWQEVPLEIGFMSGEAQLVETLNKLFAFTFADAELAHGAINIAVTAEKLESGKSLLAVSSNMTLFYGNFIDMAVAARNDRTLIRALSSLLKFATFTPQVSRKSEVQSVPTRPWLTNLRADSDNRLVLTGYAVDFRQITRLGEMMLKSGSFVEVSFSSFTRNVYEKVPVWRFDIYAKLN